MRSTIARIDAWCRRGDFTVEDIAWFRIIFAGGLLLTLQQLGSLSDRPAEQFDPPPGPFEVFQALPPNAVLEGLEIVTAVLAALLLFGLHTRAVSFLLAAALMTGFGLTFSFGKIDHTIVLVLVPALMAFSAWGDDKSIDADRVHRDSGPPEVAQWPMRFLALLIGLSFVTAGWAKLWSGWLDPDTHAVHGHFVRNYYNNGRTDWLAPDVVRLHLGNWWEVADWFTVALELGLVLTVLRWGWFRAAIAVTALFHVGILMLMNIEFSWNMFGYAAFVRWGAVLPARVRGNRLSRSLGYAVAVTFGLAAYALHEWAGAGLQHGVRSGIVLVGGAAGAVYLVVLLRRAVPTRQPATRR